MIRYPKPSAALKRLRARERAARAQVLAAKRRESKAWRLAQAQAKADRKAFISTLPSKTKSGITIKYREWSAGVWPYYMVGRDGYSELLVAEDALVRAMKERLARKAARSQAKVLALAQKIGMTKLRKLVKASKRS